MYAPPEAYSDKTLKIAVAIIIIIIIIAVGVTFFIYHITKKKKSDHFIPGSNIFAIAEIIIYRDNPNTNNGKFGRSGGTPLILNFAFKDATDGKRTNVKFNISEQDGSSDKLIFDHNNSELPIFVVGTIADITGANPPIKCTNVGDIKPSDNINSDSVGGNNKPGVGRGDKVYNNMYPRSVMVNITGWKAVGEPGQPPNPPSFGNNATFQVRTKSWKTGLFETSKVVVAGTFYKASTPTINVSISAIKGAMGVSQPNTDSDGTILYAGSLPPSLPPNDLSGPDGSNNLGDPPYNLVTVYEKDDGNFDATFFMNNFIKNTV